MATEKQKEAARRNLKKARAAQRSSSGPKRTKTGSHRLSTAEQNDLPDRQFAFPEERKEPLTDAAHVRNAIARFDQVEGVSDSDRAGAWRRIRVDRREDGYFDFSTHKNGDDRIQINGWLTIFWIVMIPASIATGWVHSITSSARCRSGHWSRGIGPPGRQPVSR